MDFDEFDRMVQSTRPSVVLLRSNVPDGVANEARRRCHRIIVIQERQWRSGPMYTVWGSAEELFAAGGLSISARDILSVAKRADGSYGYSPGETLTGLHTWMLAVHGSPFNRELRMMLQGAAQGAATRTGGSMTGTDCQACLAGEPTMGAPKGTKGQPSGACRNCSAFICEHHGQRDAGVPEFRCVQCDPKLLKASAVVIAQGTAGPDAAPPQLRTAALGYQEYRTRPDAPAHWAIQSVEDFWARRSAYGPDLMHEFADTRVTTADGTDPESAATQGLLAGLPEEAVRLLALAAFIYVKFELRGDPDLDVLAHRILGWT